MQNAIHKCNSQIQFTKFNSRKIQFTKFNFTPNPIHQKFNSPIQLTNPKIHAESNSCKSNFTQNSHGASISFIFHCYKYSACGKCFDTVIISDLHLGSEVSRAGDALQFLLSVRFHRLILLGDIFADLNFRRLTKEHWKFLGHIRKLSNPRHEMEVVWVEGNHDHGLTEVMSHLVGVPVYQEYGWQYGGKRHLAIHGHQFDSFAVKNALLSKTGQFIFLQLQKIDSRNQRFARYLDRLNTRWLRLSEQVAHGALSYAKPGKAERIFCGHTHAPLSRVSGRSGILQLRRVG